MLFLVVTVLGAGVVVVDTPVVGVSEIETAVKGSFFLVFPSLFSPTPFIWTHTNLPGVALISANLKERRRDISQNKTMRAPEPVVCGTFDKWDYGSLCTRRGEHMRLDAKITRIWI